MTKPSKLAAIVQPEYRQFVEELKARVIAARISAARAVNRDLIALYWDIGRGIAQKQQLHGWGDSVVQSVAADLKRAFPDMAGFSPANVWRMRQLHQTYSSEEFLAQLVREIDQQAPADPQTHATQGEFLAQAVREMVAAVPWGHHVLLLGRIKVAAELVYYLKATAQFGWTRDILLYQVKASAYQHSVTDPKSHNFALTLPEHLAEQADEMLKSTYSLEFLGLRGAVKERVLEDRLISRLQAFLLELGYGFCFVGRQHRLKLGQKEYFIDLLFYHRHLKALIAFELKVGAFQPEHAGKMDFYLNLLNDLERGEGDQSAIGIILCAEKDDVEVEYALRSKANPIGVATYQLQTTLPPDLQGKLPTAQQLADVVQATLAQEGE